MSDDANTLGAPSSPRTKRKLALYLCAGAVVILTLAYFDGGEEPLRPIEQSVSLASLAEARS